MHDPSAAVIPAAPQPGREVARPRAVGLTLTILALSIASGCAIQAAFSPVQEFARTDLGMSDLQLGLAQGMATAVPAALLSIPIGWMADHSNRVRMMRVLAVLWSLGAAATAFATSFELLFAARMLSALGLTVVLPVAISIAADLAPPETRGRSLLLLSMGKVVGLALAFALGGALFTVLSSRPDPLFGMAAWRATQLIFAGFSLVLVLPLLMLREPVRQEVASAGAGFGASMGALWARRSLLVPLFVGQITVIMADASASIWATPVLMRTYGLQPADFSAWMGLVLLGSGLVGTLAGGFAADAGLKRAGGGGLLMTAVVASAIGVPAALFPIMPAVPGFAIMLTILLLAGTATGLITGTAIAVLVPNQFRALCLGSFVVVGSFIGFGVAPSLVTVISEAIGGPGALAPSLAGVSLASSILSLIAFALAARAAPGRT
ncbi:MFS transporter [Brevundimonas subvibrioides]|uniref:MFS transporter n=1 Tax=Brevundimonas subvibrioides TaxID=74313 RepID=UPI0022B55D57|nr:MFS transporter [Brevundimonas subvibrioides]